MIEIARNEPVEAVRVGAAVFALDGTAAVGAAGGLNIEAGVGDAALRAKSESAAEGVKSVEWIGSGDQFHVLNGDGRYQVPRDHIAEGLVLADAVEIDRESLRRSQKRRGRVTAIVDVGLEGVVLVLVDIDAVDALVERVGDVEGIRVLNLLGGNSLHGNGDLVGGLVGTADRSLGEDSDGGGDGGDGQSRRSRRQARWNEPR